MEALQGLEVLVLNACSPVPIRCTCRFLKPWPPRNVWVRAARSSRISRTNSRIAALAAQLPAGIAPAYDGLVIDVAGA